MGNMTFIENIVDKKIYDVHTAYLAKVLAVNGSKAKIQPLGMIKQYGETAKNQAVVSNVPIAQSARRKITPKRITIENVSVMSAEYESISAGDIVVCVCCDRDITDAKNGKNSVPSVGRHHSLSDSVIVGIL